MASRRVEISSDRCGEEDVSGLGKEVNKRLFLTNKERFKWSGSFESLKSHIEDLLDTKTRWTSPWGGCKLFDNCEVAIRWYPNFSLILKGCDSDNIKIRLLTLVEENSNELNSGGDEGSIVFDKNSADNSDNEGDCTFIPTAIKCLEWTSSTMKRTRQSMS